jgi:Alr-MurF fusion protein
MQFSDLKSITKGRLSLSVDMEIERFSTDTRTLSGQKSEVFIASKGKRDGHDFIQSAQSKGIKNFIIETDVKIENANVLLVENAITAFQQIAKSHREQFHIPIICIAGSNGKTTVKEWLFTLLSQQFFVLKSPKSYNSQVGVPVSVIELRGDHEVGIFEAGISQKGEMENLQKVIQPTLGIFTNFGVAHADGFESEKEKLEEKLKVFSSVDQLICRSDQEYFDQIKKQLNDKVVAWSLDQSGDVDVVWKEGIISVNDVEFKTNFKEKATLENLTHAIVLAVKMGLSQVEIQQGIDLIKAISMRLELKKGKNGCYILDDTYNNDLMGLKVALDYLESHHQNEKRTLILSDILHSGRSPEDIYEEVVKILKQKKVERLIGVGPQISAMADIFKLKKIFFDSTESLIENLPKFQKEMIVVKGARKFELERVVQRLEEKSHGTVLQVNFEALHHNLNQYRNLLSEETKLTVMVKANAYGSGILEVANFLQHQRIDQLGVAYVDEAIALRNNGITIPILIMNPHIDHFGEFERYSLNAEIFSISHLKRLLSDTVIPPPIHIKIDSGMHRLGFSTDQIPELLVFLKEHTMLNVEGIFTHFSSSDLESEDEFTHHQAAIFNKAYDEIVKVLGYRPTKHALNSSGMIRFPEYHFDMVRLGIGLYGFDPSHQLELRTTSQLKTFISQIQHLKKGETVGYARKGRLDKDASIAVIPIGYEDGYLRVFGNGKAMININGINCPTVGNICMDMTMVDVTNVECNEGDKVTIFGNSPTIQELAQWADTIPYEVLTNVSSRVRRVFVSE